MSGGSNLPPMKPREELNSIDRTAIHEAGHVAACIILELEFDAVYLSPSKDQPGLVSRLVKKAGIDYSSGVLTPEEEVLSTYLVIAAFAGPACDALHRGRNSFDISEYDDLDEVLDAIEYRFANNNVRIAFTHYCEAEAFALFEDDRRLWRFTHLLARELSKHKKLTYAQCTELYNKEYLVESWVRKEVDEIRREGEARGAEARKGEDGLVANYEQRAAKIEKQHMGEAARKERPKEGAPGTKEAHRPPVQDREAPRHEEIVKAATEGGARPAEAGGERRGRRRRGRGRGRGRGRRREETLEQLPGEVIGGQPVPPAPKGEEGSDKLQVPSQEAVQNGQQSQAASQQKPPQQPIVPTLGSEPPKGEERVKKQIIKAIKPPEPEGAPVEAAKPAETPQAAVAPVAAVAEQRPVETPPVVPQATEVRPAAAQQPKRRPAVSGGPKAEGKAVRGGKGTTHPDSIWEGEKPQVKSSRPQAPGAKLQAVRKEKAEGKESQPAVSAPVQQTPGSEGKKPTKAAKPRTAKAAKTPAPVAEKPAEHKKAPGASQPAQAKSTKAAAPRTTKAARPAKAAVPPAPPEAPVKEVRTAPAKKAAPAKAEAKAEKKPAKSSRGKKKPE